MSANIVRNEIVNVVVRVHKIQSYLMAYKVIYVIEKGNEFMHYKDYVVDEVLWPPKEKVGDILGLRCRIGYDGNLKIRGKLRVLEGGAQ